MKKVKKTKKTNPMVNISEMQEKVVLPKVEIVEKNVAPKETVLAVINILTDRIDALEQRIDRIVTAIGKAKSVKGL